MTIFFTFSPTSNHLHPLQVENCDSNSWLVVDEDDNVKSGLKELIDVNDKCEHVNDKCEHVNDMCEHVIHMCDTFLTQNA